MSFDALYRSTKIEYPGRQMISVFGCPGSHALQRRKDLGELSGQNCDFVFITEEDSGEEPFAQIAADIEKARCLPAPCARGPRRVHPPRNSGRQGRARHSADRQGRRDNDEARQRLRPLPERRRADTQIPRRIRQGPSRRAGEQRQKGKRTFCPSSSAATKTPTARRGSSRRPITSHRCCCARSSSCPRAAHTCFSAALSRILSARRSSPARCSAC